MAAQVLLVDCSQVLLSTESGAWARSCHVLATLGCRWPFLRSHLSFQARTQMAFTAPTVSGQHWLDNPEKWLPVSSEPSAALHRPLCVGLQPHLCPFPLSRAAGSTFSGICCSNIPPSGPIPILVYFCCYNKIPQAGSLINKKKFISHGSRGWESQA